MNRNFCVKTCFSFSFKICYSGAKKYEVQVTEEPDSEENESEGWTVSKLKEEIAKLANIPVESQRLIAKGKY